MLRNRLDVRAKIALIIRDGAIMKSEPLDRCDWNIILFSFSFADP